MTDEHLIDEAIEAAVKEYQDLFGFTANVPRQQRTSDWLRAFGQRIAVIALQRPPEQ